ncbi:MAG TPA: hypothetical protein VKB72_09195 [Steroidobacteraceae bacterium]|nr:hypothetical protein [Steroidobacteraceae bacterium]
MRKRRVLLWAALAATTAALTGWVSAQADDAPPAAAHDGQRDFDFLLGSWKIHLKRRLRPLTGSNEWVEFDGTVVCRSIWKGLAEVEEFNVDSPEKKIFIQGLAVRLYNPKTHEWSIYWANRKNGVFDAAPQIGHFSNGHGEFYGQGTTEDGRPVYVRFAWSNITSSAPHFEQAFSADGGRTWEVNWITEQTRVPD